jgi:hypothetical protein
MESGVSDRDFKYEGLSHYRGQRKLFTGGFGLQGAAEGIYDILENLNDFSIINVDRYNNQDQPLCRTVHNKGDKHQNNL